MENTFWQANFWGIVGTASGALGLIISYLNWRYSRPNIKITYLCLKTRKFDDNFLRTNTDTEQRLRSTSVTFHLEIKITNKRGGQGGIEKPLLVFKEKRKHFWNLSKDLLIIEPTTKSYSTTQIKDNSYSTETINLGKSFNLKGGEIIDGELEYSVSGNGGDLQKLIKDYENGDFYIRYSNNLEKTHEVKLNLSLTTY